VSAHPPDPEQNSDSAQNAVPVHDDMAACGSDLGILLDGVAEGDWTAWRRIIDRFGPLVLHTAGRAGLNAADAADVAQLTWMLLWKHARQIREPEHLAAWLTVATRREAIRLATAASRYVPCADPETEYATPEQCCTVDAYPVEGDYDGAVEQALDRLPPRYRTLLVMATGDQCPTYAEIARKLRLPIGSIGPMRMRALEMLARTPEFRSGRVPRPALVKTPAAA
jgi:RNA polymerase sigma factor (sigma-70 family)